MVGAHSAEEVIGRSIYDLIAPEDRDRYEAFNESICRGEKGSLQFDIVGLEGKRRHMETHAAPLSNPDGTMIHLAVTSDISEREQAERAEQPARRHRGLLRRCYCQQEFGWNHHQLEQRRGADIWTHGGRGGRRSTYLLIIPAERRDEEVDILRRIRAGDRVDHFETIRQRKDGTLVDISVTISPVKGSTGRIIGASKVARDISQRRQSEIALRQSEERFRRLAETLDAEVRARTDELEQRNREVLAQAEQVRQLSWQLLPRRMKNGAMIAANLHVDSGRPTLAVLDNEPGGLSTTPGRQRRHCRATQTRQMLEELTKEIRTTSYLLHPPLLDETGLPAALSWYISGLRERSGLDIAFSIPEEFGRLPREMELVAFRLVQECLTNIHRHSGSKRAIIQISRDLDRVLIEIRDHGKGIPKEKLAQIQYGRAGVR